MVERPASIIKELVENSLDAWATNIKITINDWWKSLISVEDNGTGIQLSDMDLLLERYATSKINGEQDLFNLQSYWFRGEALASIAEVSKTTVISKTEYSEIGSKLTKLDQEIIIKHMPVGFKHGTIVSIQDLFFNVPARLKFLKSAQTEFFYCYNYFVDVALLHYDKQFSFYKNDKAVFELAPVDGMLERIIQLFKKDRSKNLKEVTYQDEEYSLLWLVSDPSLTFGSWENIKIYVNSRPVSDKVIKRSLMDAYFRQIPSGEYPFAVLMLQAKPGMVDVNVHPRKLEVKFADSNKIYQIIHESLKKVFGIEKIIHLADSASHFSRDNFSNNNQQSTSSLFTGQDQEITIQQTNIFDQIQEQEVSQQENLLLWTYRIVGQLRDSYIVLESTEGLYYIDQHALAERIAFEKMKKAAQPKIKKYPPSFDDDSKLLQSEVLLQPLTIPIHAIANIQEKIDEINELGFDCALISENTLAVYAIPQIFGIYKVDIEKLFNHILYLDHITYDHVLDKIFASKACKTSIKAWDKLAYPQMVNLIKDGFEYIDWMFVCQHGRPFFVKIEKNSIDKFFDR